MIQKRPPRKICLFAIKTMKRPLLTLLLTILVLPQRVQAQSIIR